MARRVVPPHAPPKYLLMLAAFVLAAVAMGLAGHWGYAPVVGWDAAALAFCVWVFVVAHGRDGLTTKEHSTMDDPSPTATELLVLGANVASLVSVAFVIVQANSAEGAARVLLATLALGSVVLSWLLIHTVFMLRYARLYYSQGEGGISFNQRELPRYSDFAYLSFTLGMTYQVSDTNLEDHNIRITALKHALFAYVFGSVILASVINLLVGLSS